MSQITCSRWSKARLTSAQTLELRILSAVLNWPSTSQRTRPKASSSPGLSRNQTRCGFRPFSSSKGVGRSQNVHQYSSRKRLHTASDRQNNQPAQQAKLGQGTAAGTITDENFVAPEDQSGSAVLDECAAGAEPQLSSCTCSLCNSRFPSEEAFDEHLLSCYPSHDSSEIVEEGCTPNIDEESKYLAEEQEKLEHVRRLEDELRKARHELQILHREGRLNKALIGSLDVYNTSKGGSSLPLSKQDYLNLVDLYFHVAQTDSAVSPDSSPNPIFLEDQPMVRDPHEMEDEFTENRSKSDIVLLAGVEGKLRDYKLQEIRLFESFVNLLLDPQSSYEDLFRAYKKFPAPGVAHLPSATIRTFLYRMSLPPVKSPQNMLQYLSIIDEMLEAKIPIMRHEWNSAIHLAGKSFNVIGAGEVRRSMDYWRKMETEGGIKASEVTFNILFDIAVKSGQFLLSKELFDEMGRRGLRLNRLGRVSHIWSCGKMGNADAVRQAYHDFVQAGEIVDTQVLNTVMVGLLESGEESSAEQIYERMKSIPTNHFPENKEADRINGVFTRYPAPGPQSFQSISGSNHLRRILAKAPKIRETANDSYLAMHSRANLKPDHYTYRILISHHTERTGNLDRTTVLLDDMTRLYGLRTSGLIYLLLFKGFAMHGGKRYSKWSASRLEAVWKAFATAMREGSTSQALVSATSGALDKPLFFDKTDPQFVSDGSVSGLLDSKRGSGQDSLAIRRIVSKPGTTGNGTKDCANMSDIDLIKSQAYNGSPWGTLLLEFTASPEEKEEAYLEPDPAGQDEPEAFPFKLSLESDDYYKIRPSKWLIIWAVRAFTTCTRDAQRIEEIYLDMTDHWDCPTAGQKYSVQLAFEECAKGLEHGLIDQKWWRRRKMRAGWQSPLS